MATSKVPLEGKFWLKVYYKGYPKPEELLFGSLEERNRQEKYIKENYKNINKVTCGKYQ